MHDVRCFLPLVISLLTSTYTTGCGDDSDSEAVDAGGGGTGGTDDGGMNVGEDGSVTGADAGDLADAGLAVDSGGGADAGGTYTPTWNPVTCQIDDDGSSRELGGLEVRSLVLVPDSEMDANDGTTVYYPAVLETDTTCTFSVIGWGNGTTGFGGADYPAYFEHLASFGFVVAVAHTNRTIARSAPILTSVGLVIDEASDPESVFFGKLATAFGLMGKSQGAIAISRDLADPDAVAGVLIASGTTRDAVLTKPGLLITGDSDFAQPTVINAFEAAMGPAILAQAVQGENPDGMPQAGHDDLNDREGAVELSTSFMRCHLQSNVNACDFAECVECQLEPWSRFETRNL